MTTHEPLRLPSPAGAAGTGCLGESRERTNRVPGNCPVAPRRAGVHDETAAHFIVGIPFTSTLPGGSSLQLSRATPASDRARRRIPPPSPGHLSLNGVSHAQRNEARQKGPQQSEVSGLRSASTARAKQGPPAGEASSSVPARRSRRGGSERLASILRQGGLTLSRVCGHPSGRLPVIIVVSGGFQERGFPQTSALGLKTPQLAGFGRLFCRFSGSGFGREASRWRPSRTAGEAFSGIPPRQEQRPCGSLTISAGATTRPRLNFRDHRLGRNE